MALLFQAMPTASSASIMARRLGGDASLRAEPNASAEVLRMVPPSTALRVFGRSGNWVSVGDQEPPGWFHRRHSALPE